MDLAKGAHLCFRTALAVLAVITVINAPQAKTWEKILEIKEKDENVWAFESNVP